jgi:hypothetical protein
MIEQALTAEATIEYPATGITWSMRAPTSKILGTNEVVGH